MPVRDYVINYKGDNTSLLSSTLQLSAALRQVDQYATSVQLKLKNYASGSGASASAAAKQAANLAAQLNAVNSAAGVAQISLKGIGASLGNVNTSIGRGSTNLMGFGSALVGLGIGKSILGGLLEQSAAIEANWHRMAKEAIEFRDSLRELAAIKGLPGPTTGLYADVLKFATETNVAPDKAREAIQAYENIGPTIREMGHYKPGGRKDATEAEKTALETAVVKEAVRTGQRLQLDPETAGASIGSVGMFHDITSTEGAMSQYATALKGLSLGKVEYTKGMAYLNKAAAALVDPKEAERAMAEDAGLGAIKPGRVGSFGEAGIYMGALTLGTGGKNAAGEAAQRMIQISNTLNPTDPKRVGALKAMGITDQMDDADKLITVAKFFEAHKELEPMTYLAQRKIGSEATRRVTVSAMKVADVLQKRLIEGRAEMKGDVAGKQAMAANLDFMKNDPTAAAANAATIKDVMDKVEGDERATLETATAIAEERMRQRVTGYHRPLYKYFVSAWTPLARMTYGVSGETMYAERHDELGAIPTLRRQAKKVGIDIDKQYPGVESLDPQTRARSFQAAAAAVQKAGADPMDRASVTAGSAARVERMRENAAALGGGGGGVGDGPVQQAQLGELRDIKRAIQGAGGPAPAPALGPAPLPGGAVRVAE